VNGLPQTSFQPEDAINPVVRLAALASDDMSAVEAVITERMDSQRSPLIPSVARHLVDAGGKRIRPLITVAAARMLGYEGDGHHPLAAAVEFIHSATLLHDDVVDDSKLRRGKAPANQVYGNAHSVLVGDFLFARSFILMVDAGSMQALHVLSRAAAVIAEGEVRQLEAVRDIDLSRDDYLGDHRRQDRRPVRRRRSGQPHSVRIRTGDGARAGNLWPRARPRLPAGRRRSGLWRDLAADLGKNVGDDFREGKMTLPLVLAIAEADDEERAFWTRVITDPNGQNDDDLETAVAILKRRGALDATLAAARAPRRQRGRSAERRAEKCLVGFARSAGGVRGRARLLGARTAGINRRSILNCRTMKTHLGQHVVPRGGQWIVRKAGAKRASGVYATQAEAMESATQIAKRQKTELYIHGRDGRIRERRSYGADPYPPKG
jgi:octaprenyl-diphosphate synthase